MMSESTSPTSEAAKQVVHEFNDTMKQNSQIADKSSFKNNKLNQVAVVGIFLLVGALLYFVIALHSMLDKMNAQLVEAQRQYQLAHTLSYQDTRAWQQTMSQTETAITHLRADLARVKTELAHFRESSSATTLVTSTTHVEPIHKSDSGTAATSTNQPYRYSSSAAWQ